MECPEEGRGHVKGIERLGKVTVCKDGDPSGLEMLVLSYFPAFIPCVCFFCSLCFEYSSSFFLSLQCYFLCILPAFFLLIQLLLFSKVFQEGVSRATPGDLVPLNAHSTYGEPVL